jgi:hypothetical protein
MDRLYIAGFSPGTAPAVYAATGGAGGKGGMDWIASLRSQ